jgi:hypothetical protein
MANPASVYGLQAPSFNLIMGFLLFHDFVLELNLRLPTPKSIPALFLYGNRKGIVNSKKI